MRRPWTAIVLSAATILLSCAEVAPPPGGEVDEAPPSLISVTPSNGSTHVAPTDRVILQFSERVVQPRGGKGFFVSPRFDEEPQVKWRGDRVEIVFPDSLAPDQTYIISVSSGIADLRGNLFDSAGTIAFSTGASLDSGGVSGQVASAAGVPAPGLLAALYDEDLFGGRDSVVWDSLLPTYLTTTNQQGRFQLAYLPAREYRLVVFQDRNGNERVSPSRESFAISDRPIRVGGPMPLDFLRLTMTSQDTSSAEVLSAGFTSDRLVRVRLARPIPLHLLSENPSQITLRPLSDTTQMVAARAILEAGKDSSSTVTAWFGQPDSGSYRLEIDYSADRPPLVYDSLAVTYGAPDRSAPTIVDAPPSEGTYFLRDLQLALSVSEPLDTISLTDETFSLWVDPDSTRIPIVAAWRDMFHVDFEAEGLREGRAYRLVVTEFELRDLAGNAVGDSLREYRFSTYNTDSLGSISGTIQVDVQDRQSDPVVLTFRRVGKAGEFSFTAEGSSFVIDVPAGDYVVSGFIDSDLDGALSKGSLTPFRLAESQAVAKDTVEVRARFQTSGIELIFK